MCLQDAWADAFIIQAVDDALNVTIQIVESNQGFAPLTTVCPVQERNTSFTITIVRNGLHNLGFTIWASQSLFHPSEDCNFTIS